MAETQTESLSIPVLGMSCAACQHHVEEALKATDGVESARVDLMAHRAAVEFDPAKVAPELLLQAIRSAGYDAVLPRVGSSKVEKETRDWLQELKVGLTIFFGVVAMVLSMPLMSESGPLDRLMMHILPQIYDLPGDLIRWSLLIVTVFLMIWAGWTVFESAVRAAQHGATNMNTLVSLGTGAAFLYSLYATVAPAPDRHVYFDAVLLILGFMLLGKTLEAAAKKRALSALDALTRLRPLTARVMRDGQEVEAPLEEVQAGDSVVVRPGERFPVDGTILEGRTTVDESMLTGESTPIAREQGDKVLAGSLNYDGAVLVRAQSLGSDTMLEQIARMVEQAQSSRAPMERLADKASSIFVPVVLALAGITFLTWLLVAQNFQLALASTVAVLVIACPCAMGLAVPAALTVAVGRAAQLGVLFKGGEALERLTKLDAVVLDKTGTLTVGRPTLTTIRALPGYDELDLLALAASAEEHSNHPLAHAIVERAKGRNLDWPPARDVSVTPGRGVRAVVEGLEVILGNDAHFRESQIRIPETVQPPRMGVTRLWMAVDGQPTGYFETRDVLRPDATAAVSALHSKGLRVVMLTGDSVSAATPIAEQAGIRELEAGLSPTGKLERIRSLQKGGLKVAMVGDGINDAGALAQSDAGIAMGSGTELAQETGDLILLREEPSSIPAAIDLADSTLRVMRQNLIWAAGYNVIGIPLAAGLLYPSFHILLSPWVAAAAMALSSVSVLSNSLKLRRWQPKALEITPAGIN
ncbi:MAG: copper-translocating P-type ATPase [Acidobacteriota bacterium]|nr:copper-translocating P-type ATPase [Acidobacteriota bacterium]